MLRDWGKRAGSALVLLLQKSRQLAIELLALHLVLNGMASVAQHDELA